MGGATVFLIFIIALGSIASMVTSLKTAASPSPSIVAGARINNCSDQINCSSASCVELMTVPLSFLPRRCAAAPPFVSSKVLPGKYIKAELLWAPAVSATVQAFYSPQGGSDSVCHNPSNLVQKFDQVQDTCFQFPPRLSTIRTVLGKNETDGKLNPVMQVFIQSCNDTLCMSCDPLPPTGLPAEQCYPHPGVPGLFLYVPRFEAVQYIALFGYDTEEDCLSGNGQVSYSYFATAGEHSCFGGISLEIVDLK